MSIDVSLGYDERNTASFTTPVTLPTDTRPGQIVPVPVAGPSMAPKLTSKTTGPLVISAVTLYYNTMRITA